jgi:TetR/AcrR family transcriptional regulator, regulator of cefoperazone and chloramphenicol sensitivity
MIQARRRLRADGQATRARILEAAGELFASAGYADTTGQAVANRADVSFASINYYFGGRQGLYRATLIEAHARVVNVADLRHLAGEELSSADKLGLLIEQLVRHATTRQPGWHIRLLAKEVLAPSSHIQAVLQTALPKLAIIKQLLSDITSIPANDPAIVRCLVSVVAPCSLLLIGARGAPGPLHDVRRMPREVVAAHLRRFALAGLEAVGRDYCGGVKSASSTRRKGSGTRLGGSRKV